MFTKLVLFISVLSNADGRRYLRSPGSLDVPIKPLNMSNALMIIPNKQVNKKHKSNGMCLATDLWAKYAFHVSNKSKSEL